MPSGRPRATRLRPGPRDPRQRVAGPPSMPSAVDAIAELDSLATIHRTPCSECSIVWRCWGSGPPVVLIHGSYGSWRHWFRLIPSLARRHHVLVPDLPGHGDSADPPGE